MQQRTMHNSRKKKKKFNIIKQIESQKKKKTLNYFYIESKITKKIFTLQLN